MSIHRITTRNNQGFIMPTLLAFMGIIAILGPVVMLTSLQAQRSSIREEYVQQAQLASVSAIDIAKEEYERDITYVGTVDDPMTTENEAEQTLIDNGEIRVTFQVEHFGFTNDVNTQQDIRGTGRVYVFGETTPTVEREIRTKITRGSGGASRNRFIFVVDNSGSMSTQEWNDSKITIDTAINYIIAQIPTAEVAVIQHGTGNWSFQHVYEITVPFTRDPGLATTWGRRYGPGTVGNGHQRSHLAATFAVMRQDDLWGDSDPLDLGDATNVQFVIFTDAEGYNNHCCTTVIRGIHDQNSWFASNPGLTVLNQQEEFNDVKSGEVFAEDGKAGLDAQFTVLNVNPNQNSWDTAEISAALASPGGEYVGAVAANPGDPEGEGITPRRFLNDSLNVDDPNRILSIIDEIIREELSF